MNVLIIEDEKAAARNLRALIVEIDPTINIISTIDSVVDSVEWLTANPLPDLIFMDIHLADGSAFDIFDRCRVDSPVVFTTAYDEYALKAFGVNSIDYLLKPISIADLKRAIDKFSKLQKRTEPINPDMLNALIRTINSHNRTTHLLIPKDGDRLVPLAIENILFFCIEDGAVRAMSIDRKDHVVPYTLEQLMDMIDSSQFFRANRQYIISKSEISHMELWFGGRLSVKLKSFPDTKIIINKPRVTEFKSWFTQQ